MDLVPSPNIVSHCDVELAFKDLGRLHFIYSVEICIEFVCGTHNPPNLCPTQFE